MQNDPTTKTQAEALLKEYYEQEQGKGMPMPEQPALQSWNLYDDGTMVVVDGASGRKLSFAPDQTRPPSKPFKYIDDEVKKLEAERKAKAKAEANAKKKADAEARAKAKAEAQTK